MTPFERALVGELEGSHGVRVHVGDVHGATALHHYAGLNYLWGSTPWLRSSRPTSHGRSSHGPYPGPVRSPVPTAAPRQRLHLVIPPEHCSTTNNAKVTDRCAKDVHGAFMITRSVRSSIATLGGLDSRCRKAHLAAPVARSHHQLACCIGDGGVRRDCDVVQTQIGRAHV